MSGFAVSQSSPLDTAPCMPVGIPEPTAWERALAALQPFAWPAVAALAIVLLAWVLIARRDGRLFRKAGALGRAWREAA